MIFSVNAAFKLDAAAVAFNKLPGYEQANSGADGIAGCKKGVKDFWECVCRDTGAVVFNRQNDFVADFLSDFIGDCMNDFVADFTGATVLSAIG